MKITDLMLKLGVPLKELHHVMGESDLFIIVDRKKGELDLCSKEPSKRD